MPVTWQSVPSKPSRWQKGRDIWGIVSACTLEVGGFSVLGGSIHNLSTGGVCMLGLKAGEVGGTSYYLVCSGSLSFLRLPWSQARASTECGRNITKRHGHWQNPSAVSHMYLPLLHSICFQQLWVSLWALPPAGDSDSSPLSHNSRLFSDGPKLAIPSIFGVDLGLHCGSRSSLPRPVKTRHVLNKSSLWVGGQGYDSSV